ncbi:MAG TPA: thermonuclease family protein [Melioribacteraceae bacterium]|nr:thermonuclease family protein [Melioribacteraceae bacterium]
MRISKKVISILLACIIIILYKLDLFDKQEPNINSQNTVTITKIVDGDTFNVIYNGKKEKVRLIGIDTPESKINKKAIKDSERNRSDVKKIVSLGLKAKEFVKSIVKVGDELKVEFDVRERDQYGRLLVYLYLKNGKMLNNFIIEEGYAAPLTYPPNVKYEELFRNSYKISRANNKGLWAE